MVRIRHPSINEADYIIWARNTDYERISIVEDWQSLTIDLKYDDVGTWSMTLPTREFLDRWDLSGTNHTLLTPDTTANWVTAGEIQTLGVLIFRNTHATTTDNLFSGVITEVTRDWNGFDDIVTISGESDAYFLRTRLVVPHYTHWYDEDYWWWVVPVAKGGDGVLNASTVWASTKLETCMHEMVEMSFETGDAISWRVLPYFGVEVNGGDGETIVRYEGRCQTVLEGLKDLLLMQPLDTVSYGFRVKQIAETGDPRIQYQFLTPTDRSSNIVFGTEVGSVKSFSYTERRPEFNLCLLGGPDVEPNMIQSQKPEYRWWMNRYDSDSLNRYGRIEGFADYSEGVEENMLWQTLSDNMAAEATKIARENAFNMSATIELDPSDMAAFNVDWFLGDKVTVELGATNVGSSAVSHLEFTQNIREVLIEVSPDGEIITPTVCDPTKFMRAGGFGHLLGRNNLKMLKTGGRIK